MKTIHHFYQHPATDYYVKMVNQKHKRTLQRVEQEIRAKIDKIQEDLGVKGHYQIRAEIQITMTNMLFIKKLDKQVRKQLKIIKNKI
jgi:hypothetical protein